MNPIEDKLARIENKIDIFKIRKVTTPVLLHLLRGELKFPRFFLWRCTLTQAKFKRQCDSKFPKELLPSLSSALGLHQSKEKDWAKKGFRNHGSYHLNWRNGIAGNLV